MWGHTRRQITQGQVTLSLLSILPQEDFYFPPLGKGREVGLLESLVSATNTWNAQPTSPGGLAPGTEGSKGSKEQSVLQGRWEELLSRL